MESPLSDTVPAARPITLRDLLTFRPWARCGDAAHPEPIQFSRQWLSLALHPARSSFHSRRTNSWRAHRPAATDAPAGRKMALPHRYRHSVRAYRARRGDGIGRFLARADIRSARHARYRFQRARSGHGPVSGLLCPRCGRSRGLGPGARGVRPLSAGVSEFPCVDGGRLSRILPHAAKPRPPPWRADFVVPRCPAHDGGPPYSGAKGAVPSFRASGTATAGGLAAQ